MTDTPDDVVTLEVGGLDFTGWQDVRITRGVEVFPSSFMLRLTERLPDLDKAFPIAPGERCRVKLGNDVVITGFIDDYRAYVTAQGHEVTVVGRSATEDLVDCAAGVTAGHERDGHMTFAAPTLLQLAQDLCKPFGITVTEPDGEGAPIVSTADGIPQFTIPLNSTVFEQLEVRARWLQMLVLDGTDGNLVLAKAGTRKAASGFTLPGNVLDARVSFSKQDRYTVYLPAYFTVDTAFAVSVADTGVSGNFLATVPDSAAFSEQPRWDGEPRYRPRFVVSEQFVAGINLAEARTKWQKSRDFGRSQAVVTTVATWRDDAGVLWTPNTLAPVDMPVLKLAKLEWLITEVTYIRGLGTGTRTQVKLMPREAFMPEPVIPTAFSPAVEAANREALLSSPGSSDFNPRSRDPAGGV